MTLGVHVIDRPPKLAQDNSKSIDVVKHANRILKADYIVLLNACTPLIKSEDIQACVDIATREKCESVVSLVESFDSHPSKLCYLVGNKTLPINSSYSFETGERQQLTKIYKRNTAIYVIARRTIVKGKICGKDTRGYVMPIERSIDINSEWDLKLCELILKDAN